MATGTQYTINFHADPTDNIVFDGLNVAYFLDNSGATGPATTTIKQGALLTGGIVPGDSVVGAAPLDAFYVTTNYPALYPTGPSQSTLNVLITQAFNQVQSIINANAASAVSSIAPWPGAGPNPKMALSAITTAGTGYANGYYNLVKLTGGSGYGATASIVVSGNAVSTVTLLDPGQGYVVGDVLSANLGLLGNVYPAIPGTGFTITVASVASELTNSTYGPTGPTGPVPVAIGP